MGHIVTAPPTSETRGAQMYPMLAPAEIDRMRRFGQAARFAAGDTIVHEGDQGLGIAVVLSGEVEVAHHGAHHPASYAHTHRAGSFIGELSQLSGRPWLAAATASTAVEVLMISPERLRALMVAEADLGERLMRALILRRVGLLESGVGGPVVLGRGADARVLRLLTFLMRNGHPHLHLDTDSDACARALVERLHLEPAELPIVLCPNGELLRDPDEARLARCLGLVRPVDPDRLYDLAVVGAGPAGLAASVYAASEGLSVLTFDCRSFGGQAGASARIENFLGFPTGISGMALMARAYNQAQKFGVEMVIPDEVLRLESGTGRGGAHRLSVSSGELVQARIVVLAAGARYRALEVPGLADVEATSVHYWASPVEAPLCEGEQIVLVGSGNSAGQAAVFLAGKAGRVIMLVRRPLAATMSRYLIERIGAQPNIEVIEGAQATHAEATDGVLAAVHWRAGSTQGSARVRHMFLFIGADPNTDWLQGSGIALDDRGFVLTGAEAGAGRRPMETSRAGIFAIGDVRSGSVKRVAAAAGDGAQVVAAIHQHLADRAAPHASAA
jgi:thioredoxin reductase (NADPH)